MVIIESYFSFNWCWASQCVYISRRKLIVSVSTNFIDFG
jgi:hypothetical protein